MSTAKGLRFYVDGVPLDGFRYGDVVRWRMPDSYIGAAGRFMVIGGHEVADVLRVVCIADDGHSWHQGNVGSIFIESVVKEEV